MGSSGATLAVCLLAGLGGLPSRQRSSRCGRGRPRRRPRHVRAQPRQRAYRAAGAACRDLPRPCRGQRTCRSGTGDYWSHVLYTTLEPCLLCTAALIHAHVGAVRYAASDPLWAGIEQLPRLNEHIARRWPDRQGPRRGPLACWGGLLPLIWSLGRAPHGPAARAYEQTAPQLLQLARVLIGSGEIVALRQLPLAQALDQIWPRLLPLRSDVGREADHRH